MDFKTRGCIVPPPTCQPGQIKILPVLLVDEAPCHSAWTGVEILIATPHGEIDLPVVKMHGHVAGCVGEVPTDQATLTVGSGGDAWHVKPLARDEIDATK